MTFHRRKLMKADGRALWLYGREPIDPALEAPVPAGGSTMPPNPHLRWHPLRGEWVAYAGHRQARTFLPPSEYNPLAPTRDPETPTELPAGRYDVAVFENRFPTFFLGAHDPPATVVDTLPGRGQCEVVVYTQDPEAALSTLPLWNVELLVDVWAHRYEELGALAEVAYVFPFENRGVEVGVTLSHPHGQIYAYPFVPPLAARELSMQKAYLERHGRNLLEEHVVGELSDGARILRATGLVAAFVPACARYAYEIWVAPLRPAPSLAALTGAERRDFALVLKTALLMLDGLWARPMPYIMAFHQAPTDGEEHPEAHLHAEIYPAYRMPGRLKYLAGSETGAGAFTADTLPEEKAAELRAVPVSVA
jgi:UDPglucose--hexose-1-phosphate uridylyltransferase